MVDIEMLRIEKLIEEREAYENAFFSVEPVVFDIEELELVNLKFTYDFVLEPFDYKEEVIEPCEDYFINLRDEKLIKEREIYEIQYLKNFNHEIIEMDFLDRVVESYEEPKFSKPDFEMYGNDYFVDCFDPRPVEEPIFRKPRHCWCDLDYMPHDDFYDHSDCYYYPDGDLSGFYPL